VKAASNFYMRKPASENANYKQIIQRELGRLRRERRLRLRKEAGEPTVWRDPDKKYRRSPRWRKRPPEPHLPCEVCVRVGKKSRALLHSTIREYIKDGRIDLMRAQVLLPRADKRPVALCVYRMLDELAKRFGVKVRERVWGDRLKGRNNPGKFKMRNVQLCAGRMRNGSPCPNPARRGSQLCFVHDFPNLYANDIQNHGKKRKAHNARTGEACKNHAMTSLGATVASRRASKRKLRQSRLIPSLPRRVRRNNGRTVRGRLRAWPSL